ncbi:hypothetical protein [Marinivivus vitaminiproducens]|uniref:hypothetical protein n=1 Tax=Marinivivus vitaminiproducens TaxID=3035935 RepID=UPI002799987B|nr:hypothetical protein P4R82_13755 [Geminicoccaceae bacterium SCSIO 64248]
MTGTRSGARGGSGHLVALAALAGILGLWAGVMAFVVRDAALPPEAHGTVLAVFPPGTGETAVMIALAQADARLVRQAGLGFAWLVQGDGPGLAGRLRQAGAWGVFDDIALLPDMGGCAVVLPRGAQRL